MVNLKQHRCPRVIHIDENERQNKNSYEWWMRVFEAMEAKTKIPLHKRREILAQILPEEILAYIEGIIEVVDTEESVKIKKSKQNLQAKADEHKDESPEEPLKKSRSVGSHNPYMNFFKCDPKRAAIWRPLPPLDINGMDLNQKSEAITEAIADEFVKWLENLGGETKTTLDVAQIMKMFEVGFHTHASTSLCVRVKELSAIPKFIADIRKQPNKAYRVQLKQKIMDDIKASRQKPRLRAFNTTLPKDLYYVPPSREQTDKWLIRKAPEHIASMAVVWDGITQLRSTRTFCKWLINHPKLPRPKYLKDVGMLDEKYFKIRHYSIGESSFVDIGQSIDIYKSILSK